MKKTQVALAALALVASSAAMAEGVTIYGTLDAGIANSTGTGTNLSSAGGFVAGNNIGFKGSEDLGGGMKANFQLETGFDLNGYTANGGAATTSTSTSTSGFTSGSSESITTTTSTSTKAPFFNRVATVGLSGDFGSVTFGQQLSPFIGSVAGTGTLGNGHFFVNRLVMAGQFAGAAVNFASSNFAYNGFFIPNAISYSSPSIAGFTLTGLTTTKSGSNDGLVPAQVDTDRYSALSLTGAIENVNLSMAYQSRAQIYSTTAISANTTISGFTFAGSYISNKFEGESNTGSFNAGVGFDVQPNLNLSAQYAWNDGNNSTALNQNLMAVAAKYTLSKRSFLYASYTRGTNGAQSNYDNRGAYTFGTSALDNRTTVVGVAHSF